MIKAEIIKLLEVGHGAVPDLTGKRGIVSESNKQMTDMV